MDLNAYQSLHFVGIGGMGMRALASILLEKGYIISGSDLSESDFTRRFQERGGRIFVGHRPENIEGADALVLSSAISYDNPEVIAAKEKGIPIFHRSDILTEIFKWGKGIAVAGAHGKSTTSAMLGQIFCHAKTDPTVVLGGAVDYILDNSCMGKGKYIIAEADESDGSFLKFRPFLEIITNIEDDHLDHYGTLENIKKAFLEFMDHISYDDGAVILCADNEGVQSILPSIKRKVITYGMDDSALYQGEHIRYKNHRMFFDVRKEGLLLGTISLQMPGIHNVRNALAAVAASLYCGISFEKVSEALYLFAGVKRRFQIKYHDRVCIVDDYAHHPTEIMSTLKAARECGYRRVVCVFQPHRYSRTKFLQDEFALAFDEADVLFFTDIYAANEHPILGVDGKLIPHLIQSRLPEKEIHYVEDVGLLARELQAVIEPSDVIITMGAGNIGKVGDELIELLQEDKKDGQ